MQVANHARKLSNFQFQRKRHTANSLAIKSALANAPFVKVVLKISNL